MTQLIWSLFETGLCRVISSASKNFITVACILKRFDCIFLLKLYFFEKVLELTLLFCWLILNLSFVGFNIEGLSGIVLIEIYRRLCLICQILILCVCRLRRKLIILYDSCWCLLSIEIMRLAPSHFKLVADGSQLLIYQSLIVCKIINFWFWCHNQFLRSLDLLFTIIDLILFWSTVSQTFCSCMLRISCFLYRFGIRNQSLIIIIHKLFS